MKSILLSALLALGLGACEKRKVDPEVKADAQWANELRKSPDSIDLGDNRLILTTFLYRDFMPGPGRNMVDGSNLICFNTLTEADSLPISNRITLKKQYVVNDNEVWSVNYERIDKSNNFSVTGVARNGPKWGPRIAVDVICEFEFSGQTHRILAKSQFIARTE